MKVVTLHPAGFERHCQLLAERVAASYPDGFDAVVGIRRGGSVVCDAVCRHLSPLPPRRYDMSRQRSSTRRKGSWPAKFLRALPYSVLNMMRMAESFLLAIRHGKESYSFTPVDIPQELRESLKSGKCRCILVVDDAIDSGETILDIVESIRKVSSEVKVITAVITVTTRTPLLQPDFSIYDNRTLRRVPWSNAYKNH